MREKGEGVATQRKKNGRAWKIGLAACAVVLVAGTAMAAVIFTQTFPALNAPSGSLSTVCTTLAEGTMVGSVSGPIGQGNVTFGCAGTGAITYAFAAPVASASVTPTFTLPSVYTDIYAVTGASLTASTGCSALPGAQALTSGTPVTLNPAAGGGAPEYYYCLGFSTTAGGSLPSFSISWSQ